MKNTWTDVQMQRKIEELETQNAEFYAQVKQLLADGVVTLETFEKLGKLVAKAEDRE